MVVLPAPFGPSSANTVPSGDLEVDAVEDDLAADMTCASPVARIATWDRAVTHAPPAGRTVCARSDVEVLDRWLPGGGGDHVEELGRDPFAELLERLDHLEGRLRGALP